MKKTPMHKWLQQLIASLREAQSAVVAIRQDVTALKDEIKEAIALLRELQSDWTAEAIDKIEAITTTVSDETKTMHDALPKE